MSQLFNRIPEVFFAPNNPPGTGAAPTTIGGSTDLSKEDMIEFLNDENAETIPLETPARPKPEEDEKTPPKGPKKDKEEKDKEDEEDEKDEEGKEKGEEDEDKEDDDELKDLEEELEPPTEDQLELVTPVRRKEILKKYPQLFKDFPYLEKAYYREQQFTELLPTIDDARTAVEAKQTLDKFENDLMSGNTETVLKTVREENPQAFYKIADDYLPTLARVDEKAYYHVLGNISKMTIMAMVQEARAQNNEALQNAAQILNQFVFGSSNFSPPRNLSQEPKPEDKSKEQQISQREQQFVRQQFEFSRNDLNTRVNNVLHNTIAANIDPKESMTDYNRKNAVRDAEEQLQGLLMQDSRFRALVDKLWEKAFEEGFTKESIDRIRSAFVSKSKTLLPSVIKKARNEALRGMGKRVKEEEKEDETTSSNRRGPAEGGRPRSQESRPSGKITKAKDIPQGMSTLEFLNSD